MESAGLEWKIDPTVSGRSKTFTTPVSQLETKKSPVKPLIIISFFLLLFAGQTLGKKRGISTKIVSVCRVIKRWKWLEHGKLCGERNLLRLPE